MLNFEQLINLLRNNNLSKQACQVLEQIRASEPSRIVGGNHRSVSGNYSSRKMGVTISFESHKVELPLIYLLEHDEDVLEYYDQPPPIKLSYQAVDGRNLSHLYTPDFFIIRKDSVGWVECKTEQELQKLNRKNPNRYLLDENGQWHMPPGERVAEQFGFFFTVWSDREIDWTLQRNLIFLEDYYCENFEIDEGVTNTVLSLVASQPGLTLANLFHHAEGVTPDDIYFLIATEQICVDLSAAPLVEAERCFVFRNRQTAQAYKSTILSQASSNSINSSAIDVLPGQSIYLDGKSLVIVFVGKIEILLKTEDGETIELEKTVFERFVQQGKIVGIKHIDQSVLSSQVKELLCKASERDLQAANCRYQAIEGYLKGQILQKTNIPDRTLRYWYANYRLAEQKYGYGFIGLLPNDISKGNRNPKLPLHIKQLIENFVAEDYENHKQKGKSAAYNAFYNACSAQGIPDVQIPSYKTFIKEINRRAGYEQTLKREGHRAAYSQEPFYFELETTTPKHGDRPFEIGHIDHTQLDIELRCSTTGRGLGRPWATFLIDAYSRVFVSIVLSFDPPSYRSCMMVLRACVKRYNRLHKTIVTDNGSEFHSIYFESLLALFGCTHKYRPAAKARFGSVCERLFGTSSTQLLYNLSGNTQIMKRVRQITKSVNPKNQALWTLGELHIYFSEWAYEVYETTDHPALGQSPRDAFANGIVKFGERTHRLIPYDENFRRLTLPTTRSGKAKVQPNGVKINYIYYWANIFRDPEIQSSCVDVRYDPFDMGIAYAYVKGHWVECFSEYYSVFRGRSEKEVQIASAEIHKQKQNHSKNFKLRAKHLGAFLANASEAEDLLLQRLRDAQSKDVLQAIEGVTPNNTSHIQKDSEMQTVTEDENNYSKSSCDTESSWFSLDDSQELETYEDF
jgi:transposase InsO family protein